MSYLVVVAAALILAVAVVAFEMRRTPAGITRERRVEHGRISSRTCAVAHAPLEEAIRLLETDWSWWPRARAETMTDLGDGLKEFLFHPNRFFNLIEGLPRIRVRFERLDTLPDGGRHIHATLTGDFDGRAEYTAKPAPGGTFVELAWCEVEARGVLKATLPIALLASIHCWRERLGVEGLRRRLEAAERSRTAVS